MATPTRNFVPTTTFNPAALGLARYLADGEKWGGAVGTGVTLTYSFPTGNAYFMAGYGNEWSSWHTLSTGERTAAVSALGAWSSVANVRFTHVADNNATVGEIRFTYTETITGTGIAHAYLPYSSPRAGDVWLSWDNFNPTGTPTIAKGSDDYHTLLHELGHALGLKHSFEYPALPSSHENYFYTVMSYTASPWTNDDDASFYPTTPMYYDLVAIQAMYGRNVNHNRGNTIYTFTDGVRYFETIDDAGGNDKIVYSGTEATRINLNIGQFSSLSETITFSGGYSSRYTVAIGPNSVIENAQGGSGSDTLIGNAVANRLVGLNGNDTLVGGAGNDGLIGGGGLDRLHGATGRDVLTGNAGVDRFIFKAKTESFGTTADIITDFQDSDTDLIDLSALAGTLVYRGILGFSAANQVRINDIAGADLLVDINLDSNRTTVEMSIRLAATTLASMSKADFML